jgi:tetratricopeptide (TPR) repeat protein
VNSEGNTFSPQLPEHFGEADKLYGPHPEFSASLRKIAHHIVGGGAPMTFALYGNWGAGKSTALAYLQGIIRQDDPAITFSWCQAPLWARYEDERSALALQILRGVERGIPAAVADTLAPLLSIDLKHGAASADPDNYDLSASIALLKVLQSVPNAPPVVEQWIHRYITRNSPVRHVVILDDLDRCDLEFVARLLRAMNHWTTQYGEDGEERRASIYFILACREDFLISSQANGEVGDPRQSLEKYIHVAVSIPVLLNRPGEAAGYLHRLVAQLSGIPEEARARLIAMLETSARAYPDGLLAPLLRVVNHAATPRAVKTRLNLLLTEVDYAQLGDDTLVKEWVFKAFWPDCWFRQYRALLPQPASGASRPSYDAPEPAGGSGAKGAESEHLADLLWERFRPVQAVGERLKNLLDMSDEALREAFAHVGAEVRADLTDVTPQLAIYLASDPAWPGQPLLPGAGAARGGGLVPPAGQDQARRSEADKPHGAESRPGGGDRLPREAHQADASHSDAPQEAEAAPLPPGAALPTDPNDQIFYFYLAADTAEDHGDYAAVAENLSRLVELARALGPDTSRGATVGNAALIAERVGLRDMALELHQLARAAQPEHYNIMQNYIDFILDEQITSEYPEARRLYEVLLTAGQAHRPFRTLIIGLRLDAATGEPIPDVAERRQQVLTGLRQEPTTLRLFDIIKIPPDVLGYDTLREAGQIVAERTAEPGTRARAMQVVAAALGRSDNPVHEREVVDMVRWQMKVGIACVGGDQIYANSLYTLALQLGSLGYRSAATLVYAEAYALVPGDADYRRSLASSLERMGRNEDATGVLLGQRPDVSDLEPEDLPALLSTGDGTERWWERLAPEPGRPCPTRLGWLTPPMPDGDPGGH